MLRLPSIALLVFAAIASRLGAQQLRGVVRDSARAVPLPGAVVTVLDSAGVPVGRAISDAAGRFVVVTPSRAARVRAVRIGYRPRDLSVSVPTDTLEIAMSRLPPMLAAVRVTDSELCPGATTSSGALELWEQAKAGLLATIVARETKPAKMRSLTYKRVTTPTDEHVTEQTSQISTGYSNRPFVAIAQPSFFAIKGFMQEDSSGRLYSAPDADVLLDDSFAATHCFHIQPADNDHSNQIGLAFSPARGRDALVDVAGVIWIDRVSPQVRSLDFQYTGLEPAAARVGSGGHAEFRTMPNGLAFIERWNLKLATLVPDFRLTGFPSDLPRDRRNRTNFRVAELRESGGFVLDAAWPDGAAWTDSLAGLMGSVVQRGSAVSIPGAVVALAGTNDQGVSRIDGSFTLAPLVPGRYTLVVTDTTLSEYSPARSTQLIAEVERGRITELRVDLPPLGDVIRDVCRGQRVPRGTSMLVGRVRVPDFARPRGRVVARWQATYNNDSPVTSENNVARPITINGVEQQVAMDDQGHFVVCGVARGRPVHLRYVEGDRFADTTFIVRDTLLHPVDWRAVIPAQKPGGLETSSGDRTRRSRGRGTSSNEPYRSAATGLLFATFERDHLDEAEEQQ